MLRLSRMLIAFTLPALCLAAAPSVEAQEPVAPAALAATAPGFTPVTFTQLGWKHLGAGLLYSRWRYAFQSFSFYGKTRQNWLYAGCRFTMSCEGSNAGIRNLLQWLPQTGPARGLNVTQDFITPAPLPPNAGLLAGEVVTLTLNIAFNDTRQMPRHPGYDLEDFIIRLGPAKGRTVGYVWDIANRVLGGDSPLRYGFPDHETLAGVVRAINCNYEFRGYVVYVDRGYLAPNRPLGPAGPPHNPHLP